jgi:hypothetical protein
MHDVTDSEALSVLAWIYLEFENSETRIQEVFLYLSGLETEAATFSFK